jgi:hypothetical protein
MVRLRKPDSSPFITLTPCSTSASISTCRRTFVAVNLAILLAIYIVTPTRILQSLQNLSGWLRDQGSFGAFLLFVAIGKLEFRWPANSQIYQLTLGSS